MRCLIVALMLPACTLPLDLAPDVVFQANDALLLDAEHGAEQFREVYPGDIEVTTHDEADERRTVTIRLAAPGFTPPGSSKPMCVPVDGRVRRGLTVNDEAIWVCDNLGAEQMRATLVHEMCHVFGAPSAPHWHAEGGACHSAGNGEISQFEKQQFERIWR